MSDIISLLPDSVANQIAAGEVIQRPASAVKEMLENAIDSGASEIKLLIKDAGKTLIQVIDNGKGMSETDARMCFERHATSKIKAAEDLFHIRTMGFRGEALASIAAIAQVELKTKQESEKIGTRLCIEGSKVITHEPCSQTNGTSLAVKNLFYNTPARRNFLKSNSSENKHIIEEFTRVALAHPDIEFSFYNDDRQVQQLPISNTKVRIVTLFGNNYNERLVPVDEDTDLIKITGFVGKPEFAKKSRTEQYMFVNLRYIRDGYLNHAVKLAFEELLPSDHYPLYMLYFDIDTAKIDVNVHPTKTEIKFEDERAVYQVIRASVKRALGKYNIAPSLDFDADETFSNSAMWGNNTGNIKAPEISVDPNFNPFKTQGRPKEISFPRNINSSKSDNWKPLYEVAKAEFEPNQGSESNESSEATSHENGSTPYQLHGKYILSQIKSGFMLIEQQAAHERILFEHYLEKFTSQRSAIQQCLFPEQVQFTPSEYTVVQELLEDLTHVGFDIAEFGNNTVVVQGVPVELEQMSPKDVILSLIQEYSEHAKDLKLNKQESLARSLAKKSAVKPGQKLELDEMRLLIDQLFACEMPYAALNGKPTLITLSLDELAKRFNKSF
ncbi:MAG: DNA mismatch repair protein MutL [Sphingobacteriales bacterium]|jgi:DNA mismatch repair protein MutL